MTDDAGRRGLEDAARRQISRLVDAIDVGAEPLLLPADRPDAARTARVGPRRQVAVAAGLGAVAAVVVGVVALTVRTESPMPDVAAGVPADGQCVDRVAHDGVIGTGSLPDGDEWEFRIVQEGDWLNGWVVVDGQRAGGWGHDDASWPSVVNAGMLEAQLLPVDGGWILSVLAPPGSASVTVEMVDGREFELCPAAIGATSAVEFAAGFVGEDTEVRTLRVEDRSGRLMAWADDVPYLSSTAGWREADERMRASLPADRQGSTGHDQRPVIGFGLDIDPSLVQLPLGGVAVPDYVDPLAAAVEVASGELPSGPWSVRVGSNGDEMAIELTSLDAGGSGGHRGTADQILADLAWDVMLIDGRYLIWGFVPDDVATVVVSLAAGTELPVSTVQPDISGLDLPAFGAALPEGAMITNVEGRDASGTARYRADVGIVESLAGGPQPASAGMAVQPVG